jgi:DtxR family transcriptional regulator, Mn-dependent transcriptional regulator
MDGGIVPMNHETTSDPMSESMQMYLVTIARERTDKQPLPLSRLADTLGISAVSVNEMCRKLQDLGLVTYRPYVGVSLTADGEQRASYVLRRHRLWEVFLVSRLGFSYEDAHEAACNLEHSTPDRVADRLDAYLDYPATNPEGAPIPRSDEKQQERLLYPLTKLTAGQNGHIVNCQADDSTRRFLNEQGLRAGARIEVIAATEQSLLIQAGDGRVALTREMAEALFVDISTQRDTLATTSLTQSSQNHEEENMATTQRSTVATQPLSKLKVGQNGIVVRVSGKGPAKQRMMDMGLVPGSDVKVVRVAPLGDPMEFEVKGYRLSLRKSEASAIIVELTQKEGV